MQTKARIFPYSVYRDVFRTQSNNEVFSKNSQGLCLQKSSIIDVWLASKYVSGPYTEIYGLDKFAYFLSILYSGINNIYFTYFLTASTAWGSYWYCTSKSPRPFVPRSLRIFVTTIMLNVISLSGNCASTSFSVSSLFVEKRKSWN